MRCAVDELEIELIRLAADCISETVANSQEPETAGAEDLLVDLLRVIIRKYEVSRGVAQD